MKEVFEMIFNFRFIGEIIEIFLEKRNYLELYN